MSPPCLMPDAPVPKPGGRWGGLDLCERPEGRTGITSTGPAEMGSSPAPSPCAAIPGTKRAADIKIWLWHCHMSQLYPEIPACPPWDAWWERAGSVVPRLFADTGVDRGAPLGPVWDFHYQSSKPERWHGTAQVLASALTFVEGLGGGPHVSIPAGRLTAQPRLCHPVKEQ